MARLFALVPVLCLFRPSSAQVSSVDVCNVNGPFPAYTPGTTSSLTTPVDQQMSCPGGAAPTPLVPLTPGNFELNLYADASGTVPAVRSLRFNLRPPGENVFIGAAFLFAPQTVGTIMALPDPLPVPDTNPALTLNGDDAFRLYNGPAGAFPADVYATGLTVQRLSEVFTGRARGYSADGTAHEDYKIAMSAASNVVGATFVCNPGPTATQTVSKYFTVLYEADAPMGTSSVEANVHINCIPNFLTITIQSCGTASSGSVQAQLNSLCDDLSIDCLNPTVTQAAPSASCPTGLQNITVAVRSLAQGNALVTAIRAGEAPLIIASSTVSGIFADGTIATFDDVNPSTAVPGALPVVTTIQFCGTCSGSQSQTTIEGQVEIYCAALAQSTLGTCALTTSMTCVADAVLCPSIYVSRSLKQLNETSVLQTLVITSSNVAAANALATAIRSGLIGGISVNANITSVATGGIFLPIPPPVPEIIVANPGVLAVTECLAECGPSNCPATITSSQEAIAIACICRSCSTITNPITFVDDDDKSKLSIKRELKQQQQGRIVLNAFGVIVALTAGVVPCFGSLTCCQISLEDAANAGVPFGDGATCFCPGIGIIDCPDESSSSKKGLLGLLGLLGLIPLLLCCCLLFLCCIRRKRAAPDVPFAVFDPHQGTVLPPPTAPIGVCGPSSSVIPSAMCAPSPTGPGGVLF